MIKFGVVIFPGSNCDADAIYAVSQVAKQAVIPIWHKDTQIPDVDCIILPGGFSYGDYLRPGAVASRSPVIQTIKRYAVNGGKVIGICNGFQVLVETNLLPGVLLTNQSTRFISRMVTLEVQNNETPFTCLFQKNQSIRIPIAHKDGNYFADADSIRMIQQNHQIVFTYQNNPNGSVNDIAGICNREKNVLGLMPHPERACESLTGSSDGLLVFQSIVDSCKETK
jgi:phosphoribosylformylglycinamidine synthase